MRSIRSLLRYVLVALALTALAAPCAAEASMVSAATSSASTSNISTPDVCSKWGISGGFQQMRSAMYRLGGAMATELGGYGMTMLRGFLILAIAWYGVLMMMSTGTALAEPQDLIMKLLFWAFVYALFSYYAIIYKDVSGAMNAIGSAAEGMKGGHSDPVCLLLNTGYRVFTQKPHTSHLHLSVWHLLSSAGALWSAFMSFIVVGAVRVIVFGLLLVAALVYALWSFVAAAYLALAFGLGPVFLPMMMFRFTRDLAFEGWLGFAWTALLYQVVAPAVLGLVSIVTNAMLPDGNTFSLYAAPGPNGVVQVNIFMAIYLVMTAALVVWLSWRIPEIVRQIAAGAAHAGSLPHSPIQAISRMRGEE